MNPKQTDEPIEFHLGTFQALVREAAAPAYDEILAHTEAAVKQAREDTFNLLRTALNVPPSGDDRWTFIQYCLNGWIESGAEGFLIVEHDWGLSNYDLRNTPGLPPGTERRPARIVAINQGDEYYRDAEVKQILESGKTCAYCGIPLQSDGASEGFCARNKKDSTHKPEQALFEITHETIELGLQRVRHATNVPDAGPNSGERNQTSIPYLGQGLRDTIIEADLTNEASQLDIWSYTAIVEIACLGEVTYA